MLNPIVAKSKRSGHAVLSCLEDLQFATWKCVDGVVRDLPPISGSHNLPEQPDHRVGLVVLRRDKTQIKHYVRDASVNP